MSQLPQEGEHWHWKHDPGTKLIYLGTAKYDRDRRTWHQFKKIDEQGQVWCEVLSEDLRMLEKSNA